MKRFYCFVFLMCVMVHGIYAQQDNRPISIQWLTPLKSDFNINGKVELSDFVAFINQFGSQNGESRFDARFDLVQNGSVDFSDFLAFVSGFGKEQTVLDVRLFPLLDSPGGLQLRFYGNEEIQYTITHANFDTLVAGISDTSRIDIQTNVQGQFIDLNILGVDTEGEGITGSKASYKMPVHYLNIVPVVGITTEFQIPDPLPAEVWMYGVMDTLNAGFRITIANTQDTHFVARLAEIPLSNNKGLEKINIISILIPGTYTFLFRNTEGGNLMRLVLSDNPNLLIEE